jgi:putative tricarboxylic transport membrane protein
MDGEPPAGTSGTDPRLLRRVHQAAGAAFLALGLYVLLQARGMEYATPIGPGAGFFPYWLGWLMTALSALWLGQVTLGPLRPVPPDFVPGRRGAARTVGVLLALVVLAGLVDRLGYCLSMLAFVLVLLLTVGRQRLVLALPLALAASFGLYYVFRYYLGVQLPPSAVDVLAELGF